MTGTVHDAVRGNAGIVAQFAQDADPAVDYDGDIRNFVITSADKDDSDLTFAEAASGDTKDFSVTTTALQSTQAGSFWLLLWENPGAEFAVTYGPYGNAVPTADKPHFLMTLKANGKPEVGTEAKRSKERATFDYTFEVTAGPTLDTGV